MGGGGHRLFLSLRGALLMMYRGRSRKKKLKEEKRKKKEVHDRFIQDDVRFHLNLFLNS